MRLAVIMAACVAGAALLAAMHPAPPDAYEAAGTIVIPVRGEGTAEVTARTRQAAELLRQPSIVGAAIDRALQGSDPERVLHRLEVRPRPDAGIVGFSVRAATAQTAHILAEALGRATVEVMQLGRPAGDRFGLRIVGDFEVDADGWVAAGPEDGVAIVGVVPGGRYAGTALRAFCERAAGCGAARVIEGHFPAGRLITMTAWVRDRRSSRVLLALGTATGRDFEERRVAVGREWRRFAVEWTPELNARAISLQVVNAGPGHSDVEIDGVLLLTEGHALTKERESMLFAERGYAYASAISIVDSRTSSTHKWALIGAGAGLLVGVAGVAASMLAKRRLEGFSR